MIHVTNLDCIQDAVRHATCQVVYEAPLVHVPNVGIFKEVVTAKNDFIVHIFLGDEILIRIFEVVANNVLNLLNAKYVPTENTWEWNGAVPFEVVPTICGMKEVDALIATWAAAKKYFSAV